MKCPYCGNTEIIFIRRARWARFIPGFEYYDCNNCGGTHSRFFIRPAHSFFIAIATFLITVGIYWLKNQTTPPFYSEVEKYIASISQPMMVTGQIEYPPVQITKSSPAGVAEHAGVDISPERPSAPKPEEKSTSVDAEPEKKVDKEERPSVDAAERAGVSISPETPSAPKPERKSASVDTEPEEKIDKEKLKIKVLIGNRKRTSAERLAVQLKIMGYTVDRIDTAPRSNFNKLTIYSKEEFRAFAREIGQGLGKNFINKKLSWESRFDLILVTGENG